MVGELAARFVLGGLLVSLFALLGEAWKPKTFAGLFGAAPSVAIATLVLVMRKNGAAYAATEGAAMAFAAIALLAYTAACAKLARSSSLPVWASAALAWVIWFAVALGPFAAARLTGVL